MSQVNCEVSTRCRHRAYVVVHANGVSREVYRPVPACRTHVAMMISIAMSHTKDVRIRGVKQ